ncbi:MAG: GNAT family N-acetyltransferase [Rubrivivax sp.]|jgi:GNAT superfamily N-acetyltransferase|nr:GNAT family N-acetyltransferase [Rubrivivax sp.]
MKQSLLETAGGEISFTIRYAHESDLYGVASLLDCLGYSHNAAELDSHFRTVLNHPEMEVFVAVSEDQEAVGLLTLRHSPILRLNGYQINIEELVVHPGWRGYGIGGELLAFARRYALQKGAVRIEVHTSRSRESYRRQFYQKNGFVPAKSTLFRIDLRRTR